MSQFEPIQFVDADAQRIQQELISVFEQETGQVLYPGDPRRLYLLQLLPLIVALKNDINYTGNANLLPFASGAVLDGLGERIGVPRLGAQKSRVTMRFTLSAAQAGPITVPLGTRVTPDGILYFATLTDLIIAAGATTGDVIAEATVGGAKYNDFVAGQINIIVDPAAFVANTQNIDKSLGGSDVESNDAYRERQRLAPDSFSVAGPERAYIFFAKSADVNIEDVSVTSPSAGAVNVYVLMKNGVLPTAGELANVLVAVSAKDRRPLTDNVQTLAPAEVNYTIGFTYYISSERSAEEAMIKAAVESEGGAVDQYNGWQNAKMDRDVTPDELVSRLYKAGAYRVVLTNPAYAVINPDQVAKLNGVPAIIYGGLI